MTSRRQRNDADGNRRRPFKHGRSGGPKQVESGAELIWGWHAVRAALANPARVAPKFLMATPDRARQLNAEFGEINSLEITESGEIGRRAPQGAVHQGVLLKTEPLEPLSLEEIGEPVSGVILMLDQVTDPQNVGTLFRSAAAFGLKGVVLQDRHAPHMTGALAKAAAGAVDVVPHCRVVNLSRALETLADMGWRAVGLDSGGEARLDEVFDARPVVLVVGSEGEGLRRLVAEHCDILARIDMPGGFESLNVSAAGAIALYEATRQR